MFANRVVWFGVLKARRGIALFFSYGSPLLKSNYDINGVLVEMPEMSSVVKTCLRQLQRFVR